MSEWARGFGEYVVLIAGVVGVALIAALIVLALSRVTFPTLRLLWRRASPLGRFFGALLFLICSINATTKAPIRSTPKRVAVSAATTASESQPTRIEKWFRRGAWRDDHYLKFDTDWVFPHGTNHYLGIWIYSWGKLAAPRTRQSFAALGTELALFPEESEVTWERTSSNSYRIAWQNGFPDRHSRENAISASFELFRNGDIAITTNNVTRYIERELPFDCAGRGQDTAWVAANYPNDTESIAEAGGYAAWVDEKVGVELENGLYRFTATFPTTPLEAIELFVGPYTVAVTNAGDYVFLLEKGRDYSFGTRPFVADVTYAAVDDFGTANNMLRSTSGWRGDTWSMAGGGLEWTLPTEATFGKCCWLPYFQGAPDLPYLSTSAFPSVFEGVLSDAAEGLGASYEWQADYDNLEIKSPNERETEVAYKEGADSKSYALSVTATLGEHKLTSMINGHYWTNSVVEETSLTVSAPKVLVLPSNAVKEGQNSGVITIDLKLPEGESGTLSLECVSGADKVQLSGATSWQVEGSTTKEVEIVAKRHSSYENEIKIVAKYTSVNGNVEVQEKSLLVIEIRRLAYLACPQDETRSRFAIREVVNYLWSPGGIEMNITCNNGAEMLNDSGYRRISLPPRASFVTVTMEIEGTIVHDVLEVVEPQKIGVVEYKDEYTSFLGVAGGIRVYFIIEIQPTDVPFFHLDFMEVPQIATDATGYFAQPQYADYLDHGKHGAGEWNAPNDYNQLKDTVSTVLYEQPWLGGGSFTWPIPYVWRLQDEEDSGEVIFANYTQRFELDANGTARIKKFGYCAERTTNNVTRVTGGSQ